MIPFARLIKGGIVVVKNSPTLEVLNTIVLQYNPESLNRTLQEQNGGEEESRNRSGVLRLIGPAIETFSLEAEIDATDQDFIEQNSSTANEGIYPQLALLETLIYPTSNQLLINNLLAQLGTLEILPMESPLTLFVWGKKRVLPVRLTEVSFEETAFDPSLNPIRATVKLGMRVLSVDDLGFDHPASSLFMTYLQQKESLAAKVASTNLNPFGIGGIR